MRLLAILTGAMIAAACRPTDAVRADTASSPRDCSLLGPAVSPPSATLHPGDTLRARQITRSCDTAEIIAVRWTSSDTIVAVVDPTAGLIRARTNGTATIIAAMTSDPTVNGAMALNVVP